MALVSPGVEVSVIDESQYNSASNGSIPYILIATASNKVNASGSGVATGTLPSNANKTYLISSQRELVNTYGNPFFYTTTNGTPINGYELNEYGLMAAYSVLGVSNRAYVQRVDVDLAELSARLTRPTGEPANDSWWVDTGETEWGISEWNTTTNNFDVKQPIVITTATQLENNIPKTSVGNIGDYAVNATNANNPVYYKNYNNTWVLIGSDDWKASWPTIQGSESNPTLTIGDTITINGSAPIALTGTTVVDAETVINAASITGVSAFVQNGKLSIYAESGAGDDFSSVDVSVTISGTGTVLDDLGMAAGTYNAPILNYSTHTNVPRWRSTDISPRPSGSVWIKTTAVNSGTDIIVKQYNAASATYSDKTCPVYETDAEANYKLDPANGGANIAKGSVYAQYDVQNNDTSTLKLLERIATGNTVIVGASTAPSFTAGDQFSVSASAAGSSAMTSVTTVTINGTEAEDFVTAFLSAGVDNVTASVQATGAIAIEHTQGGVIYIKNVTGTPIDDAGFVDSIDGVRPLVEAGTITGLSLSNWNTLVYTASNNRPGQDPLPGTKWYYSVIDEVDIMIHDGQGWAGYRNVSNDIRGMDLTLTDPEGPQVGATAPSTQASGDPLVYGDLWLDTSDLDNYPMIYRWENPEGIDQWVPIDNADQTSVNGVVFADARWDLDGTTDPVSDPLTAITDLLTSDYIDPDAPEESLYPTGTLLFNTRRSGYTVKEFRTNYFNEFDFDFTSNPQPAETNAWVTVSGNKNDGSPYMGRQAQRAMVVEAMKAAIDTSTEIREEQRYFNLIASPGYPELHANMVRLNNDRRQTAFVIGDTPMRMDDSGNSILEWSSNNGGLGLPTGDGLAVTNPYLGVFYPSGQTNDLEGNPIVVPPSHAMLRTIIRNDQIAYPWFAPAGTRRGTIDNMSALGYVDNGEFVQVANRNTVRDTLYENNVNPLTFIQGTGLVNYGNKTTHSGSALDRINVSRLVAYMRRQIEYIAKNYLFEPNDKLTRDEIKGQMEQLCNDLVAKRALYDYLVVCDESNNTPYRIDRNELWVDIAIEPVKAVEFIYIPLRIKNTGEISGAA